MTKKIKRCKSNLKTVSTKAADDKDLSPRVKKLSGYVKLPKGFDYKRSLLKELPKKFSK